jgi:hypothetical protein
MPALSSKTCHASRIRVIMIHFNCVFIQYLSPAHSNLEDVALEGGPLPESWSAFTSVASL